ncbi:transmembrane and immunoglobulin domain-containing protein 1 [Mastacembelus armatus]|uniref:Transmembrane and immunoglobulin domain containing 1 n=1 Tax=Mastacembelus armatus TaxID=205130 RepID=A0A3Q3MNK1_9TELE|nr:transmembrane and immunoglobulin domain-containing protein 1-like [Mastacembelus armatus]
MCPQLHVKYIRAPEDSNSPLHPHIHTQESSEVKLRQDTRSFLAALLYQNHMVHQRNSKMKLMFTPPLFHLLLCCATQTFGVKIQSDPILSTDGIIQTELDETVSLLCLLDDDFEGQADEELVWLRNGAVVRLKEDNKKGNSSVCITPVLYEDNGATFTCHLSRNATVKASVTLNVTYRPQLSGSAEVAVEDEATLVMQCDIWANPPVSSISWTLNGKTVDLSAGGFTVTTDAFTSQLTANSVEKSFHEGTYQCTADSPIYGKHSKLFHVTVVEKTIKFPLLPIIAGLVVVCLTAFFAAFSRWKKIAKCCKGK